MEFHQGPVERAVVCVSHQRARFRCLRQAVLLEFRCAGCGFGGLLFALSSSECVLMSLRLRSTGKHTADD